MVELPFFKYSQDVFKFFGLWCKASNTKSFKARSFKYAMILSISFFIPIICISDTIAAAKTRNIALSFITALYGFAYLVCLQKLAVTAFENEEIYSCILQLETMSLKFQNLTNFQKSLKTYKNMSTMGSIGMNLAGLLFIIAPSLNGEFPYNPHLPHLNFTKSPNYELMFVYQAIAVLTVCNVTIAYDTLFCGFMSLCAGVLASIRQETSEIVFTADNSEIVENSLRGVIQKLVEISNLINRISYIFSFTTLTSILYNCFIMALGLFMVSTLPFKNLTSITMLLVIFVEAFELWIYCYFGQAIVNEKQLLQTELYCTEWYKGSKKSKSMIILTIFESQNDCYIKAGRILPLSMKTFQEVLKKAYAFYAFMNEAQ